MLSKLLWTLPVFMILWAQTEWLAPGLEIGAEWGLLLTTMVANVIGYVEGRARRELTVADPVRR